MRKLLMISTDRGIFKEGSAVRARQVEYSKDWDEVHIIVFSPRDYTETSIAPNVWVYPTRSILEFLRPIDATRLAKWIAKKRGITHVTCQDPFETGIAGVSVKRENPSINLELQIHTDIGSRFFAAHSIVNRVRMIIAKSNIPKADHLRVVSERIYDYVRSSMNIDAGKIELRPIFVDTNKIRNSPVTIDLHNKYPQFSKIILMVCRLEKEKNIPLALKSLSLVVKAKPDVGMVIVGNGSLCGRLENLAEKLCLNKKVVFETTAGQETIYSYYKTSDLFLLTSWFEGYGMVLAEASAAGAKIISTDVGIAREVGADIVGYDETAISKTVIDLLK